MPDYGTIHYQAFRSPMPWPGHHHCGPPSQASSCAGGSDLCKNKGFKSFRTF